MNQIKTDSPEFMAGLAKWQDATDVPSEIGRLALALQAYEAAKTRPWRSVAHDPPTMWVDVLIVTEENRVVIDHSGPSFGAFARSRQPTLWQPVPHPPSTTTGTHYHNWPEVG